jgi:hypothetical protein
MSSIGRKEHTFCAGRELKRLCYLLNFCLGFLVLTKCGFPARFSLSAPPVSSVRFEYITNGKPRPPATRELPHLEKDSFQSLFPPPFLPFRSDLEHHLRTHSSSVLLTTALSSVAAFQSPSLAILDVGLPHCSHSTSDRRSQHTSSQPTGPPRRCDRTSS